MRVAWPRELQSRSIDAVGGMARGELDPLVAKAMIRSLARWGLSDHQIAEALELNVEQVRRAMTPASA